MSTFIQILKLEIQSRTFDEILDQKLPLRTKDQQTAIVKEILEMLEQNMEAHEYSALIGRETSAGGQEECQDTALLAQEYLRRLVNDVANKQSFADNHRNDVQEQVPDLCLDDENEMVNDEFNFWLSEMRPEDEFLLEDGDEDDSDNSGRGDDLEDLHQPTPRMTIEDVWMKIVYNASRTKKSAGAA
jgi:hypothetical protein